MSCATCKSNILYLPFRRHLAAGNSDFSIEIPSSPKVKCHLHALDVVPAFFNNLAHKLQLDAEPELEKTYNDVFQMLVKFKNKPTQFVYKHSTPPRQAGTKPAIIDIVKEFNDYFENSKPPYVMGSLAFIDWCILDISGRPYEKMNEYVEANIEDIYGPGEEASDWFNALPPSVRDLDGVNNYALPQNYYLKLNLRLRLNVAPFTKLAIFGTAALPASFGFSPQSFTQERNKALELINDDSGYRMLRATLAPAKNISDKVPASFRMNLSLREWRSQIDLPLTPAILDNPDLLLREVNSVLRKIGFGTNYRIRGAYNANTKQFSFNFPKDGTYVMMHMSRPVASALGFFENTINVNSVPGLVQPNDDRFNALVKSRALVYDTGNVFCVQLQASSSIFSAIGEHLVAWLKPTGDGRLERAAPPCHLELRPLGQQGSELSGRATVDLRLAKIENSGKLGPLNWECGAVVEGFLVGHLCNCL